MFAKRWVLLISLSLIPSICSATEFQGYQATSVNTFVSPDSSYEAFSEFLSSVDSFLYISAYKFDNPQIGEDLKRLLREGKNITIIVDDSPAGGFSETGRAVLSSLEREGAQIYLGGDEFRFYHAKYGISDNETLFLSTENLGVNGFPVTGHRGNRGWGIILESPRASEYFAGIFSHDLEHSQPFVGEYAKKLSQGEFLEYSPRFRMTTYIGNFTAIPIIAPVDAVEKMIWLIDSANESLLIEQFYAYKYWGRRKTGSVDETPNLFLEASIDAARRGVSVKILLDDTWYNVDEEDPVSNLNTVRYVNDLARREGLDLEARLVDSEALGLEKIHTKGLVVDERIALISSINWNENSPTNNREAGIIIIGEPAGYYARVFEHDWNGEMAKSVDPRIAIALSIILGGIIYLKRRRNV